MRLVGESRVVDHADFLEDTNPGDNTPLTLSLRSCADDTQTSKMAEQMGGSRRATMAYESKRRRVYSETAIPVRTADNWTLFATATPDMERVAANVTALLGEGWALSGEQLRAARVRAQVLIGRVLRVRSATESAPHGAYDKLAFDMLAWSHTDLSRCILRICLNENTHAGLEADRPLMQKVVAHCRLALRVLCDACALPRLQRFDEAGYPSRGEWNNAPTAERVRSAMAGAMRALATIHGERNNNVYLNVMPPSPFMRCDKLVIKIGHSARGGESRLRSEAHAGVFRPLCDVYVRLGARFEDLTHRAIGVTYTDEHREKGTLFEHYLHVKYDAMHQRHWAQTWNYTHRELFDMSADDVHRLLRGLDEDAHRHGYRVRRVDMHEATWAKDHKGWVLLSKPVTSVAGVNEGERKGEPSQEVSGVHGLSRCAEPTGKGSLAGCWGCPVAKQGQFDIVESHVCPTNNCSRDAHILSVQIAS